MFKHANTIFPGEKVRVRDTRPGKIAEERLGRVDRMDPDTNTALVVFDNGRESWVSVEQLSRA